MEYFGIALVMMGIAGFIWLKLDNIHRELKDILNEINRLIHK